MSVTDIVNTLLTVFGRLYVLVCSLRHALLRPLWSCCTARHELLITFICVHCLLKELVMIKAELIAKLDYVIRYDSQEVH